MSYDEWKTRGHDAGFCKVGGCDKCEVCHEGHVEKLVFKEGCDFCQEEWDDELAQQAMGGSLV